MTDDLATVVLIARIEEQERRLVFPRFDNDDAWRLGTILAELAQARQAPVTIDIRRSSRLEPDTYAAHGGAFPITLAGAGPIGTVAVSGLPQGEDHDLVVAALESYLNAPPTPPTSVR
jgi:uncharacterized protein (UPF0303 family)